MSGSLGDELERALYERTLNECLKGELRIVNAGLPRTRKRLSHLLTEDFPQVVCNDGSAHLFKKDELHYLASMLDSDEQEALFLPMLIEVEADQAEAAIICGGKVEQKVVSRALDMPVSSEQGRIRIYRPQLALLRKKLKTTTAYIFSARTMGQLT